MTAALPSIGSTFDLDDLRQRLETHYATIHQIGDRAEQIETMMRDMQERRGQ